MAPRSPIVALGELLWDLFPGGRRAGGAPFNFAFHCHQLGHPAVIVSRVGDDDLGRDLRAEVRRLGMSDEYLQTDPEHPTGTVTVEVGPGGQPTFSITDDVAWDYIEWEPRLGLLAESAQAVCFGTLAQRAAVSRNSIQCFLDHVRPGVARVLDLNLRPPFVSNEVIKASATAANWLKLNSDEVGPLVRVFPSLTDLLLGIGSHATDAFVLGLEHDWDLVCVTCGADGATLITHGTWASVPGIGVRVADTVGAGDAFTAALLTQRLEGKSLREAARFANAYAAVVASKPGGTPRVERAEVEGLL